MKNILVIAAHPDDEILGLGGTIRRYVNNGCVADCVILGEGATSRSQRREDTNKAEVDKLKKCTQNAAKVIGYRNFYFCGFPDNRFDSIDLLDIIKQVTSYIEQLKPDTIFTHHYGDLNIDHRRTFEAVMTACRPIGNPTVEEVYCFETPSSTEWNFKYGGDVFKPNVFIDIQDTLEYKLEAMKCYKTEVREYPHPRSLKALAVIASRWGTVVGKNCAEAFELVLKIN